jgi:NAD(P)-dependent dehydrogenase (short-subunit alcohol dehydrogenase family)
MKKVLVTGTGSGIGEATARLLAEKGFFVYANVLEAEELARWEGVENVKGVRFDIRQEEEVARAFAEIRKESDELHGVVNNAGISNWGPVLDIPDEYFRNNLETNLLGTVRVTRTFLPLLSRTSGRVVNVSSISGRLIFPFMGPYHITKAALEAFSDTLRRELLLVDELKRIQVSVVEPGSVDTRLWDLAKETTIFPSASPFYRTALDIGHGIVDQEKAKAFPPRLVARTICRALRARRPKTRYLVSPESPLFRVLLLLPDRWLDWLCTWLVSKFKS